ncbi:MAG: sugar phosphate nucleotidyltransferase [Pseudomonadota bacterium]
MTDPTTGVTIYPVILCGGSGTRLWPVSSRSHPKPFLPLIGDMTLFEQAIARVDTDDGFAEPIIVAGQQHCDAITQQMHGSPHRIVVEPASRNTAPAIALAAAILPVDAIMLVCPSDHHIADTGAFRSAARAAAQMAREGRLVSFGITPEHPETGYGYLRRGGAMGQGFEIAEFVEKPGLEEAQAYLASGEYSWNGGIFAFRAGTLLEELASHRPEMARLVTSAIENAQQHGVQIHPAKDKFDAITGESIDYAVMESTNRAAMVPADMGWSDIGNWAALQDALKAGDQAETDANGNTSRGIADFDECRNVLAFSDGPRISAVGLEDICIVVTGNEVMVTRRADAQRVGKLPGVLGLKTNSKAQGE